MIEDKQIAKGVLDAAFAASKVLNNCLFDVVDRGTKSEIHQTKRAVGKCMGEVLFELINPILKQHPDLKPPEMK